LLSRSGLQAGAIIDVQASAFFRKTNRFSRARAVKHGIGVEENQVCLHGRHDDAAIDDSHMRSGKPHAIGKCDSRVLDVDLVVRSRGFHDLFRSAAPSSDADQTQ
jgi:hypothetical protein